MCSLSHMNSEFEYHIHRSENICSVSQSFSFEEYLKGREREREMTTKGHHKKSLSTPVPASESEFIEPSSVPKTDLYVSFGSTGKISVRLDSNVEFVN